MYWKLAIQNIRRSLRDYIIYFVTLTFTALCDVLLFRDELFYYESFGLFAVLLGYHGGSRSLNEGSPR